MNNLVKPMKKCSSFCIPLIIYIVISVISLILSIFVIVNPTKNRIGMIIAQLVINCVVGGIIYWLCTKCNYVAAWIVLLFPIIFSIIFGAIAVIGGIIMVSKIKKIKK